MLALAPDTQQQVTDMVVTAKEEDPPRPWLTGLDTGELTRGG